MSSKFASKYNEFQQDPQIRKNMSGKLENSFGQFLDFHKKDICICYSPKCIMYRSLLNDSDMASVYQFWHSIFLHVIFHLSTKINVFFYWIAIQGGRWKISFSSVCYGKYLHFPQHSM